MKWRTKIILFLGLTAVPLVVGKFVIPLDFYAFRVHEILDDQRQYLFERGPYYPDQHAQKMEEGDIGRHTPYAVKKHAEWHTDTYGYRNRSGEPTEVVLVGRSEASGLSLSQEDTLAEALQRKLGTSVYSYAPKDFAEFLKEKRFEKTPPKVVILTMTEREFHTLISLKEWASAAPRAKRSWLSHLPPPVQIYWDKTQKKPLITHYLLKSLLYEYYKAPEAVDKSNNMLFFLYALYKITGYQSNPALMGTVVRNLKEYQSEADKRGTQLIFVPVPTKENIYWDRIPDAAKKEFERPVFTSQLIAKLREQRIPVVELEPLFVEAKDRGEVLYQLDDTHWNPRGVLLAVSAISEVINELGA